MLNADHHHSPPRRSPSPAQPSSFLQMPMSLLGSMLRKQTDSPVTANVTQPSVEPSPEHSSSRKPALGAPFEPPTPSRPTTASSTASAEHKPKKRVPRPKTVYNLALPPPSSNQKKLSSRPKVLLQLHQVVASRRPKPVYEVIPYSILGPISRRRLAPFLTRKLGPADILIVKTEGYEQNGEAKSEDENWGSQEAIAVICPAKEEKGSSTRAELLLDNGQTWEVTPTQNGGYDFNYTDDHGLSLKSRWVPKVAHNRRQSNMSPDSLASPSSHDDRKFNFSTISANSRRHPVIATMTRSRIEIHDSYVVPTATSPPTPSQAGSAIPTPITTPVIDMETFLDNAIERLPVTTDDALRRFIVVSGVWVAFCENWSPAYSSARTNCPSPSITTATFRGTPHSSRNVSMPIIDTPRSASPASTIDEKCTIPRIIRTSTQVLHRNHSFTTATPEEHSTAPSSPTKTRSRRSNSTGTADLVRSGSSKKRFGLEDQTLVETEEERQVKRSTEIMRIKELSLPPTPTVSSPTDTLTHTLTPIISIDNRSLNLPSPDLRGRPTRSAYEPVPTAGLWDSGVVEGGGMKRRPTSMVVLNQKKAKAKKKEQRSKSKDKIKELKEKKPKGEKDGEGHRRKSEGLRHLFSGMFRKEKKSTG